MVLRPGFVKEKVRQICHDTTVHPRYGEDADVVDFVEAGNTFREMIMIKR